MTGIHQPRYYQVNATLDIALTRDDNRGLNGVVDWIDSCLNAQPCADVTISNVTGYLSWAEFLDAPIFGPDHPNYAADADLINKVDAWLKLDRKALIAELIQQQRALQAVREQAN